MIFLTSCSESFKTLDNKLFNEIIAKRTDIKTPEELIKIYYNYPTSEGNSKFAIYTENLSNNSVKITLIHEGIEDDSISGEKIIMTARLTGQKWIVLEIKKNWKCWDGRGHRNWGTSLCK